MGNKASKSAGMSSESNEYYYTALAAEMASSEASESDTVEEANGNAHDSQEAKDESDTNNSNSSDKSSTKKGEQHLDAALPDVSGHDIFRNIAGPSSSLDAAVVHLTVAIRAAGMKAHDALELAIEALKKIGLPTVVKAAMVWMRAHPWETAAIVIPLVLLACTPALLGAAGFTATGVAAGTFSIFASSCITSNMKPGSIAAGVQAGIGGSVAAGSRFAILASVAMGGYGVPIVFGGLWGISSAVGRGLVAFKRWWKKDDDGDKSQGVNLSITAPNLLE
jgi:hypothetical protein